MRAAIFRVPGQPLAIETVPDPEPGPDELIVRVEACGICGSDLHVSQVSDSEGGIRPLPMGTVMGHEFSGEVVAIGPSSQRAESTIFNEGQRVTALPYLGCGGCVPCMTGNGHRCSQVRFTGLGSVDGGYAEYVRVGQGETLVLPCGVDTSRGAMVEPLAVGLHAVNRAQMKMGDNVLIVGAGPVGLAVALWARFFGAREVVVSDRITARAERSVDFGATHCIDAGSEPVVERFKQIAGNRPDIIVDAVGVPGSLQLCMDYAPMGARIVVVGVCMHRDAVLPVKAITKELDVAHVYMYTRPEFQFVVDMLDRDRIDVADMVTDRVGFEDFADAFEALKTPTHQCKVMLHPHGL